MFKHTTATAAIAALLAITGCSVTATDAGKDPGIDKRESDRSLSWFLAPERIGDRSGNPSCEVDPETLQWTSWRQAIDISDYEAGLKKGAGVRASREGSHWRLTINGAVDATSSSYVVDSIRGAFNSSCRRQPWRLDRDLEVYSELAAERKGPHTFHKDDALVVTDAGTYDGVLYWTVEHPDYPEFGVRADELEQAGRRIDVPRG